MKIVTWNCNGALRKKFEVLSQLDADIYIIQECENPIESQHPKYNHWAENHLWTGDSKNKGLGIFAGEHIKLKKIDWSNTYKDHSVKYFLPCSVDEEFDLLGVWTHQNNSPNFGYIGQLWKYLQVNKKNFKTILIAGDFNSNTIWDEWDRWWNHSDVVKELKETGIESLYHRFTGEQQGQESQPTLYMYRNIQKPYHIDYMFAAQKLISILRNVEVRRVEKWLQISDHLPLICEFDLIKPKS